MRFFGKCMHRTQILNADYECPADPASNMTLDTSTTQRMDNHYLLPVFPVNANSAYTCPSSVAPTRALPLRTTPARPVSAHVFVHALTLVVLCWQYMKTCEGAAIAVGVIGCSGAILFSVPGANIRFAKAQLLHPSCVHGHSIPRLLGPENSTSKHRTHPPTAELGFSTPTRQRPVAQPLQSSTLCPTSAR